MMSPIVVQIRNAFIVSIWSTSQPKFWPKKLDTNDQTRKKLASTVSRVASRFSRFAFALK
jgi:hypothetical protein